VASSPGHFPPHNVVSHRNQHSRFGQVNPHFLAGELYFGRMQARTTSKLSMTNPIIDYIVILSEAKNLVISTTYIFRYAQGDKQPGFTKALPNP
jgi:hypothetical protein